MPGFWFTAMVAGLVAAGVVTQLGWQLPPKAEVKRLLRLDRLRAGQLRTRPPAPAVFAERH
ncbi:hypothetical protein [Mycolicibacterium gadium]|uniref:Uncharacterized protein n=1 Tax=Mycolicibacterium gadium TaxID=1794 RepID=A0ABT6GX30_MYCGU|nr:hypothetical protein [Mycolicibacterium gadium]MDG5486323.1 hypothetical protein [Mycolicibacterium gadium]